MKAIIIGGGVIGISTAYFLKRKGFDVEVVDRREGAGLETSFANGSLLTPSMSDPWNAPGCWQTLLASLFQPSSPLKLRIAAIPSLLGWGIGFLANSNPEKFLKSTSLNLRLAMHSLAKLDQIRRETSVKYSQYGGGTLRVFRDEKALSRAVSFARFLKCEGLSFSTFNPAELVSEEPALEPIRDRLVGGIRYPADEAGDARRYCEEMQKILSAMGVTFGLERPVSKILIEAGVVSGIQSSHGRLTADVYIVACGSYSPSLLRPLGVNIPVMPAKGYSVTFEGAGNALRTPLVDDSLHAVLVPLGNDLRVAGTAEFAGFDLSMRAERIANLHSLVRRILPQVHLSNRLVRSWCGLRPMSVDGVPVVGRTFMPNLYVNTGHGHLGWTMAAGSGDMLADLISSSSAKLDYRPYSPERFRL